MPEPAHPLGPERRRGRPRADAPRVLFLGGLGRSGSTLVERLVGEIPGTCSLGEVVHLWERALRDDELCSCGQAFSRCPFWSEVGERAFGGWGRLDVEDVLSLKAAVDRNRHLPALLLGPWSARRRRQLAEYVGLYERLYRAAAEISGADVVVDSSKHASLAYALRRSDDLDLRVVHMVRDARAVAHSWARKVRRPEASDPASMMPTWSPLKVALWWDAFTSAFLLLGATRTPVHVLRYEDVVAETDASLRGVAEHAGLAVPPGPLPFLRLDAVELSPSHTVAGNPMRFTTGVVALRRDDEWTTRMPRRARRTVGLLTAPLRLAVGYRGSPRRRLQREPRPDAPRRGAA